MNKFLYLIFSIILLASCSKKPVDLNVMSYNIRYDNPDDSLNNWQYRKNVAAKVINSQNIDILGTQEVLVNQLNDIKNLLPEYNSIGVGREDGKEKGEYSAIFYKKDRFTEVRSGYFWLSETPDIAGSKGWDGACERIATWVILDDVANDRAVFVLNTHLDHVGKKARQEGVSLILDKVRILSEGLPIIITGDFNAEPESDVIKHVLSAYNGMQLFDSRLIAVDTEGYNWTFHGFGRLIEDKRDIIDYIFVNDQVTVSNHSVLPDKLDNIYLSDHCPVVSYLTIK